VEIPFLAMHGYRLTPGDDRGQLVVEASSYSVDGMGSLVFFGGAEPVEHFVAGDWLMIDEIGSQLCEEWPPSNLELLVNEVATALAVGFGHYVHRFRDVEPFEDWRCNEVESLTQALVGCVGLTTDDSDEYRKVRSLVTAHFHMG
jgi:hypothetical protein